MRQILAVALCLLWAQTALSQDTLETFKAGYGDFAGGFYIGDQAVGSRVAIRLPETLTGRMIYELRAQYLPPNTGAVSPEVWEENASFAWGLCEGTAEQPTIPTMDQVTVNLKSNPDLRTGGWEATQVEWPILEGRIYWLVGYWQTDAAFVRLTRNQYATSAINLGYEQDGSENWQPWYSSGLEVEVAHGVPGLGTPSGILDLSEPTGRGDALSLHASVSGGALWISLEDASGWSNSSYALQVVNVLGQTVVSHAGHMPDAGELRIPWSANRPSGVYFCRIRLGNTSYSMPVVNMK